LDVALRHGFDEVTVLIRAALAHQRRGDLSSAQRQE